MKVALHVIIFWLYIYLWLAVPGIFVGWLLHRYWRSALAVGVSAEAFTLLAVLYQVLLDGLEEIVGLLVELHFFLFVPILLAISIGYYGSRYIGKTTARTRDSSAAPN
jgi:hypothetical protein